MSRTRNLCIARGQLSSRASGAVYVVPAGFVLILKSVAIQVNGNQTGEVDLVLIPGSGAGTIQIAKLNSDQGAGVLLELWTVLNAGDTIYLASSAAPISYWLAGAVLPDSGVNLD